jgi:hypothetical protein
MTHAPRSACKTESTRRSRRLSEQHAVPAQPTQGVGWVEAGNLNRLLTRLAVPKIFQERLKGYKNVVHGCYNVTWRGTRQARWHPDLTTFATHTFQGS